MVEQGFYKLSEEYRLLVNDLGGTYADTKERPIYCCMKDKFHPFIYWAIPTSKVANRSESQLTRIQDYCNLSSNDIRSCFYHIGKTNIPAIYKISNLLPITGRYIGEEYHSKSIHLILKDPEQINAIRKKASMILSDEKRHPNKYQQHITAVYNYLVTLYTQQGITKQ
jgi:hypothetical protein